MDQIRVLHFVSSLSKSSGVMSVIMNYYRHINREKIQFDFAFFKDIDNTYEEEIKNYGGKVFLIPKPSNKSFKERFAEILVQNKYIALHIHEVYLTFLLAPIAKKNGIPNIITHSHATMYSDKLISSIRNRILCLRLKKHATHYFACSKAAGEFLYGKKSLNSGSVVIINNAIDLQKYKFNQSVRDIVRRELGLQNNFVVGHIGRFNKQKNHIFLIEIFDKIRRKNPRAKLLLVGEGPLFEQVKEKINQLDVSEDIILLGKRNDVPALLQAMDVFILPSLFEGLPVVAVEAQASGLPIVMSSNITMEVGLHNYKFISLNETPEHWADEVLKMYKVNARDDASDILVKYGFDINVEANKLEKLYMDMKK